MFCPIPKYTCRYVRIEVLVSSEDLGYKNIKKWPEMGCNPLYLGIQVKGSQGGLGLWA